MTRTFRALVTAVVAFALVARPAAAAGKPRVVYGGDAAAVPYESVDAQGRPQGFNIELLRALGQRAGVEIEFRFDSWARILERLDAGEIDLVSMAYSERPGEQRLLDTLRRELYRLGNLMSDLLEYGKPSELDLRPGSIADAARDAVAFCEGLAARASVRLSFSEERTPLVIMDRARLAQVFQNLVQNAIQHSPAGGEVRVRASVAQAYPDEASCSVRDAGAGFAPADLARVFEPFFTRRRGGTGLGLSLVLRVVELHGGSVVAGNHAEGGGLLTVRMPGLKTGSTGANIHTHGGS